MLTKEKQENFVESQKILDAQNWCIIRQNNHLEAQNTLQQGQNKVIYFVSLVKYNNVNGIIFHMKFMSYFDKYIVSCAVYIEVTHKPF